MSSPNSQSIFLSFLLVQQPILFFPLFIIKLITYGPVFSQDTHPKLIPLSLVFVVTVKIDCEANSQCI